LLVRYCLVIIASCVAATAQCTLNVDMPGPFISSGYPVAWPKSGIDFSTAVGK
jgi:hypothetical protein